MKRLGTTRNRKWSTHFYSCEQGLGVVQSPWLSCKASLCYISRANLRLSINLCVSTIQYPVGKDYPSCSTAWLTDLSVRVAVLPKFLRHDESYTWFWLMYSLFGIHYQTRENSYDLTTTVNPRVMVKIMASLQNCFKASVRILMITQVSEKIHAVMSNLKSPSYRNGKASLPTHSQHTSNCTSHLTQTFTNKLNEFHPEFLSSVWADVCHETTEL